MDLCIHLGEISAEYGVLGYLHQGQPVWRVSPDGEIRDQFYKLQYIFALNETDFFNYYSFEDESIEASDYLESCRKEYNDIIAKMPEIPFSNIWVASKLSPSLPDGCCIHLGILNSTRSWNFFKLPETVSSFANVGGFGIDGGVSSLVGASLANRNRLYLGVVGDLAFFYDMNVLGNRHIGNNFRLLVINNGKGVEFRNFYHPGALFGDDADKYIAAGGHFGNKSPKLLKSYAESLGFEYISASSKDEFLNVYEKFISPEMQDRPLVFEVFTNNVDESDALKAMWNIKVDAKGLIEEKKKIASNKIRKVLGRNGIAFVKKLIGRK